MIKFDLLDYWRINGSEFLTERPQLVEAATVVDKWIHNGKEGDVLNISMPPRFGKSYLASVVSVWLLLKSPNLRILRASYSADLAESFGIRVRMEYEKMCEKLGLLSPVKGTRARWTIGERAQPSHSAVGISGSVTGFGFDFAIIDDTAKNMVEALSKAHKKNLLSFKESVLQGRLEGQRKILNIGTRWAVDDWFSLFPNAESYVLPAMRDGASVCEAWKSTAQLERERRSMSDAVWQAQFMQRPTDQGFIRVFEDWQFQIIKYEECRFVCFFTVTDPSKGRGGDYFVTLLCGVTIENKIVVIDSFIRKFAQTSEFYEYIKNVSEVLPSCTHYIENNGVGSDIIHDINRTIDLIGFPSKADKYARIFANADKIKDVRFCDTCDNLNFILSELSVFPSGAHDDVPDCVNFAVKAAAGEF